jgi:hypothetical protein
MSEGEMFGFAEARRIATSWASASAILERQFGKEAIKIPVMSLDDFTRYIDGQVVLFSGDEAYGGIEFGEDCFIDVLEDSRSST